MPNHVKTRMQVTGPAADIERLLAACFTEFDGRIGLDFEKIIPMPASIQATSSPEEDYRIGVGYLEGLAKTGIVALGQEIILYTKKEFLPRLTRAEAKAAYDANPRVRECAAIMLAAYEETGCLGWYDWSVQSWGTKWSAYSHKVERPDDALIVKFDTAWSVPWPILEKLVADYPALNISGHSLDECLNFGASFHTQDGLLYRSETKDGARMERLYAVIHGEPYAVTADDDEDEAA